MNKIIFVLISFVVMACSVKNKEAIPTITQPEPQKKADGEPGFRTGNNSKILLKELSGKYILGEENKFSFRIVDENLRPLRFTDAEVKVEYHKVSDPKMGGEPDLKWNAEGEFETDFYFCHHGLWEFNYSIVKAGKVVDTFRYQIDVKEVK